LNKFWSTCAYFHTSTHTCTHTHKCSYTSYSKIPIRTDKITILKFTSNQYFIQKARKVQKYESLCPWTVLAPSVKTFSLLLNIPNYNKILVPSSHVHKACSFITCLISHQFHPFSLLQLSSLFFIPLCEWLVISKMFRTKLNTLTNSQHNITYWAIRMSAVYG